MRYNMPNGSRDTAPFAIFSSMFLLKTRFYKSSGLGNGIEVPFHQSPFIYQKLIEAVFFSELATTNVRRKHSRNQRANTLQISNQLMFKTH